MKACSITPYEGNQPYIFISYAHRDAHMVYGIIEELDRRGYRVWYDDGVAPGSEWPEDIAQHLSGCYLTVACISPDYILSANCRRELTFALSKGKNFLAVMLEPTEMSLGLEMQLSAQLMLMKYNYKTDEQFFRKLCACPDIVPCKTPDPAPVVTAAVLESRPPKDPIPMVEPDPKPLESLVKPDKPKKVKKEKPPKKRGWWKPLAAAAVVLGVALWLTVPNIMDVKLTETMTVARDTGSVQLDNQVITADTVKKLNRLDNLNTLEFNGCSFEPGALAALELPETIKYLRMIDCSGVDTVDFLQGTALYELDLSGCDLDGSMLSGMVPQSVAVLKLADNPRIGTLGCIYNCTGLTELRVQGTGINTLSDLPSDKLVILDFSNTGVADVSPLAGVPTLMNIHGADTKVTSIDALAGLENLKRLDFSGCELRIINGTFACLSLNYLDLSGCGLENIDAFKNCTKLETVDLSYNNMQYIASLEKSRATLTVLNLNGNTALNKFDLDFLVWVTGLRELRISDIQLETLKMLKGLTGLKILEANRCGLRDISGLSDCTGLTEVYLQDNRLTDVSVPGGVTATPIGGIVVDLGGNPVSDLSGLPRIKYHALCLLGTNADIATMAGLDCTHMVMEYSDAMLDHGEILRGASNCYVVGTPQDKVLALQDAVVGDYGVVGFGLTLYEYDETLYTKLTEIGLDYDHTFQ